MHQHTHPTLRVDIRYPIQALQHLYEMRTILEEVKAQQVTYERPPTTTFYATHLPPAFNENKSLPRHLCVMGMKGPSQITSGIV